MSNEQLEAQNKKLSEQIGKLQQQVISAEINTYFAGRTVSSGVVSAVKILAKERVQMGENGNKSFIGSSGQPASSNIYNIAGWVESLATSDSLKVGKSKLNNSGGGMSRDAFDELSAVDKSAHLASGGDIY